MFNKRYLWGVVCLLAIFSFAMSGCGGGGSSGSSDMMTGDNGMMPTPCPEGQMRNDAGECVATPPPGPSVEVLTERAKTKRTQIEAEAAQTTDLGIGGDDAVDGGDGQQAGSYNLNIEYGETSIVKEAADADDNETFMQAMDFGDGRTMHVLKMDAATNGDVVEEVVIVATDIEAPSDIPFALVGENMGRHTLDANPDDDGANQSLAIDGSNLSMVSGVSGFPSAVLQTAVPFDENAEFDGMFDGASGTYTCASTGCTLSTDADGDLTAIAGTWHFTPSTGATVSEPDDDYLRYGFWLERKTDKDGVLTYEEVETFAGSSVAASGGVGSVTGKATYSGGAVGVYVRETYDTTDGSVATATSGHFTADTELTAYFGQTVDDPATTTVNEEGQIPPNKLNSISGTIGNFVLQHGEANDWTVSLQGAINTGDGTASGTANGGGTAGTFSATFHGVLTTDNPQPGSVVGEFNANFGNGLVAGGFGAR